MKRNYQTVAISLLALTLCGCFTGIESTPKITVNDVRKENIKETPEQLFMSDITPERPAAWQPGKDFYVTDSKIGLLLSAQSTFDTDRLVNQHIYYRDMQPVMSLTGDEVAQISFTTADGDILYYRTDIPYRSIMNRDILDVPFTIEQQLVDRSRERLAGNVYYITIPIWYNEDGSTTVSGLRHVPVIIDDVVAGNSSYPLRVLFHRPDIDERKSVYMTVGNRRTSTRNFDTLFAFDNPRVRYSYIKDDVWDLIVHSRVQKGMTKEECRLALGAPTVSGQRPTTAGMVEYWSYAEGIYLLFEDGYLSYIR